MRFRIFEEIPYASVLCHSDTICNDSKVSKNALKNMKKDQRIKTFVGSSSADCEDSKLCQLCMQLCIMFKSCWISVL